MCLVMRSVAGLKGEGAWDLKFEVERQWSPESEVTGS